MYMKIRNMNDVRTYEFIRDNFLYDYGRTEGDVFVDNGREYIYVEDEDRMRRVEVPRREPLSIDELIRHVESTGFVLRMSL